MTSPEGDQRPINLFYSYSHEDQRLRKQLEDHLALLKRQGIIEAWHDRMIGAGQEWKGAIDQHLEASNIILLLISASFLASDYCYDVEMKRALEKHEAGDARVIPIILRPVDWSGAPFSKLQALPMDGKAVTRWSNRDEGWNDVANGIRKACEELRGKDPITLSSNVLTNLPQKRNPFFTGREQTLDRLRAVLISREIVALSGLGGIGKTQIAVEYAYQHRDEYKQLLWTKADQRESLVSGFVTIATLLNLPGKNDRDQTRTVAAVMTWLESNTGWLLIVDNADDLAMAGEFIPMRGKGHVLLTTQAQATGSIAPCITIKNMEILEGALFLLRRAKFITQDAAISQASEAECAQAEEISKEMSGLPLALDQAGAYIEETGCNLTTYLGLYRTHGINLLKRRGIIVSTYEHPDPVATTLALSFEKVKKANPAAAELLRFCSFLNPDAIPEELITQGAAELGSVLKLVASDPFELNNTIAESLKYSLLRRDPSAKLLHIHRLVQATLKEGMNEAAQRRWAERVVRVVNRIFPDDEISNWTCCERVLPHAQACSELIEKWSLNFPEATLVLERAGSYLHDRGRYREAEPLYLQSLAISEKVLGSDHPEVADTLNLLGVLYRSQGRCDEAEQLHQRALAIREKALRPDHPDVATSLNNLAGVYYSQDRYVEAEPLYQRALSIREKVLGPEHPDVAGTLNNLAGLYNSQEKHAIAEPLFQRALAIQEKVLGPEHPHLASSLRNLAALYHIQGRDREAEPLFQRALAIREKVLGPDHPDVAGIIIILATFYLAQDRYDEAELLCRRALRIREEVLGPEHRDMASILEKLVRLHRKLDQALKATEMEADAKSIHVMHTRENKTN